MRDPDHDLTFVAAVLASLVAYVLTAGLKLTVGAVF